jgi:hypothetical protein
MKVFKVILAAALLMALLVVAVPGASAQLGKTWTTGFQVQNLSTAEANITLTFFDSTTGNQAGSTVDKISASGSKTYFPVPVVAGGFNGSVVISSDQPVAAILNVVADNFAYNGSVSGLTAGSTKVGLPLIQKGNAGTETWFAVQNTGQANASATVTFTPRDAASGNAFTTAAVAIKPGASKTFDTSLIAQIGNAQGKFVGSATVNSTQPVAVVVNQTGLGAFKVLQNYDGFADGSPTVTLPLIQNGNGSPATFSGIAVQNVGTAQTNITVTFSPNTKGAFQPQNVTFTAVGAGQGRTINTGAAFGGNDAAHRYVGAATITNSAGQKLVAVVNQLGATTGSSYEGFNPAAATAKVSAPLLMSNNSGFFTGTQCANVGNADTTITLTYGANTKGTFNPTAVTQIIKKGQSGTPILQTGAAFGTNRYVGGGTITASGNVPIVCVVNQLKSPATADQFQTYDAVNF